ncbi:hypothetical protein Shyhy01_19970 [Streptomyces hygroscopicus subsp. hygroscopicus]|nr:hypothetical protein Shyhy01_19970 [Streptomyces hygroscopicus subsp. hygroscopicus]
MYLTVYVPLLTPALLAGPAPRLTHHLAPAAARALAATPRRSGRWPLCGCWWCWRPTAWAAPARSSPSPRPDPAPLAAADPPCTLGRVWIRAVVLALLRESRFDKASHLSGGDRRYLEHAGRPRTSN